MTSGGSFRRRRVLSYKQDRGALASMTLRMRRGETGSFGDRRSAIVRFIADRRDLRTRTPGNIDEATFVDGEPGLVRQRFGTDVPRGAPFFARGWAVDLGRRDVPWDIRCEVDGAVIPAHVEVGDARPDIVKLVGTPAVMHCGFRAYFDTSALPAGPHEFGIRAIVGRRGTAFARIPSTRTFFIHDRLPRIFAPPDVPASTTPWFVLDDPAPIPAGSVLELTGWALDERGEPLRGVAARLDGGVWETGAVGVARPALVRKGAPKAAARAGFRLRSRLDTVSPGVHRLQLAGLTVKGGWLALGAPQALIVTFPAASRSPWPRTLYAGGEAVITTIDGVGDACWSIHRLTGAACAVSGVLRRSSRPGTHVTLVARSPATGDVDFPAWSAPTANPNVLMFGTQIDSSALRPGRYRLHVDAPDASARCVGRADTGCTLVVERTADAKIGEGG